MKNIETINHIKRIVSTQTDEIKTISTDVESEGTPSDTSTISAARSLCNLLSRTRLDLKRASSLRADQGEKLKWENQRLERELQNSIPE